MEEKYPKNLLEFENWFGTEAACRDYLLEIRWPDGFKCPRCASSEKAWKTRNDLFYCSKCGAQTSITAGTIFHQTRKPLQVWFKAMWHVTSQKYGANALGLQRTLDLGSYNTAWQWLHKLRRAMVRPGRDKLVGTIEVDEAYVGGAKPGKRGRGSAGKALVGVAVEDKGDKGIGRIRLQHLEDASGNSLIPFVENIAQRGSVIRTDDWRGYNELRKKKFKRVIQHSHDLKLAHLVASLLKRWLLGTYQGAVRPSHLSYYLDEFTFRFNRRTSRSRGKLFFRLVQQTMMVDPAPISTLKGPALSFLEGIDNKNFDPLDIDHDHNI